MGNPEHPLCTPRGGPASSPPHKTGENPWAEFPPRRDLRLSGGTLESLSHQHVLGIRPWGRVFPQSQLFRSCTLPRSGLMAQNPLCQRGDNAGKRLQCQEQTMGRAE